MVLKYRVCVLTLVIILITCYSILLFVFISITFTVKSVFWDILLKWLCGYVKHHTLNDKIISFNINITFTYGSWHTMNDKTILFNNTTFSVKSVFLRYPFDVTLCLCIPSYFERHNYFMMWLCTYVSCHTLNDKIILFINITFTVNPLFLWYTFDVPLYLCIPSYFEPHYYFIYYYYFNC